MRSIRIFLWAGLLAAILAAGLRVAWSFSLLGPTGNAGDAWQVAALGYPIGGDIGSAKNFGEGYRRNTPTMYYSPDANFLTYFGSNGVAAVDGAFAIMNGLTNVDSYSQSLSEFPLYSQHVNYLAQTLALSDLKSVTLGVMVEEMGLVDPVQYTWTLRARTITSACPVGSQYLVVQRNFDINLNQPDVYSPYVNGVLYSYDIFEGCNAGAITVPFSVDPYALIDTPVAAFPGTFIDNGYFYTGLTRDDVAGLRYLYSTNNIDNETAATGSDQLITNSAAPVLQTTEPFGALLSVLQTDSPATLETNFPGLVVVTSTNYFTNIITTNFSEFYTNNPGPSITNFQPIQLLTTLDLGLFTAQVATNSPAQLLALYPGLLIVSSNAYYTNIPTPNIVTYFKAQIGAPAGTAPKVVTVTNGYTPNFFLFYTYVFGNIFTNSYSSNSYVSIQTVTVKTPSGAPAGSPGVTNTTTTKFLVHKPGGEFFIMPTNWCGFKVIQNFGPFGTVSTTNIVTLSNFVSGVSVFTGTQTTSTLFTNHTYVIEPGTCEPTLAYATNYTTNIVVQFQNTLANIVTNFYSSNSTETVITTNIGPCTNGLAGTLCTNITTQQVTLTNVPSGDFFIPPAAWCGYTILSTLQTTPVYTTNTVTAVIPAGITNMGQQYSVTTITVYTNHTFLVAPLTCTTAPDGARLREGIERIQFVKANFDSLLSQTFRPITNYYTMVVVSNSQPMIQYMRRIVTAPDILFTTQDRSAFAGGYAYTRNINFNQANILANLAGPGTINPPTTITYNRSAPVFYNSYAGGLAVNTNALLVTPSEVSQSDFFAWGSFDASSNNPVAYPDGTSIVNLENQLLVQITPPPPSLPDGTNNVPYPATTFTASGGSFQPPFTWSLPVGSALPMGLSLSSGGTITGTPSGNPVGIYGFVIQLTDSLSRTVTWNYTINIPQ